MAGQKKEININQMYLNLSRLTVYSSFVEKQPVIKLMDMLKSYGDGMALDTIKAYSSMVRSLLAESFPKYTGNLLKDYVICCILEDDNSFTNAAAMGRWDLSLSQAARGDIDILLSVYNLPLELILKNTLLSLKGKKNDRQFYEVVWAGDKLAGVSTPKKSSEAGVELSYEALPSLDYTLEEDDGQYVGEARGTMSVMFMQESSWEDIADELWHFHSICGCGDFVKHKMFLYDGALTSYGSFENISFNDLFGFDNPKRMLIKNTLQFINSKTYHHMLIYGGAGMGKTSMAQALICSSLANLRAVMLCPNLSVTQYIALFETLSRQPLKFILYYDDLDFSSSDYKNLARAVGYVMLNNIMICATSQENRPSIFTLSTELEPLTKNQLVDMVSFILQSKGIGLRRERIVRLYCTNMAEKNTSRDAYAAAIDAIADNS